MQPQVKCLLLLLLSANTGQVFASFSSSSLNYYSQIQLTVRQFVSLSLQKNGSTPKL